MSKVVPLKSQTGDVEAQYQPMYNSIVNEKNPAERFNILRSAGVPIAAKRKIKQAVEYVVDNQNDETCAMKCIKCKASCNEVLVKFELWRSSFKQVESMYGSGVLSFFVFLKSIFILNIFLTLLVGIFVILPQATKSSESDYSLMIQTLNNTGSSASMLAASCSITYYNNITSLVNSETTATKVQDVIQGTGWMENSILFMGYYFPNSIAIASTYYDMPVAYLLIVAAVFFFSLIFMLNRTGAAFKEAVLQDVSTQSDIKFSLAVFCGWDYSITDEKNVQLYQMMSANNLIAELEDEKLTEKRRRMQCTGKCCLFMKRLLVNIIILGLLGGAGYVIYLAQTESTKYTTQNTSSSSGFVYLLWQYLPSITISLIAASLPALFALLVRFEEYRPETALILTLLRTMFLRLAALAVLIWTIYNIVTCETKNSCDVGTGDCPTINCWETYVGQAFYKLEITFFVVILLVTFLVELPRALIGRKCKVSLIGPIEVDIPDSVLQVMYSQVIVWFGFYFCPFLPPMNMIVLFILFYLKKFACHFSYKPSDRPFKSSRATMFFMLTLFLAYFICAIPIGYIVSSIKTSNTCSPYRVKEHAYTAITDLVSGFDSTTRLFINFLGSPGFLYFIIIVLIIVIYYFRTLASARRAINKLQNTKINETQTLVDRYLKKEAVERHKKLKLGDKYTQETGKQVESYEMIKTTHSDTNSKKYDMDFDSDKQNLV